MSNLLYYFIGFVFGSLYDTKIIPFLDKILYRFKSYFKSKRR